MDNSGVWRGQIDYLMEEWKRFVELREELLEWIRKAEAYLERDENVYGFTVSELEEQIDKHKVKKVFISLLLLLLWSFEHSWDRRCMIGYKGGI